MKHGKPQNVVHGGICFKGHHLCRLGLIEILRESNTHYHMSLLVYIDYICFNPKFQCLFNLESCKELHDLSRVGSIETWKEESSNKLNSFGTWETHVALFFGGFVSKVTCPS